MGKNKEEYNESSQRYKTWLHQFVYCKRSQTCIHKSDIYLGNRKKLKNVNPRCSPNELAFNFFNSFLSFSYNNVRTKFVKLIGIYQLFVLLFYVAVAQTESTQAEGHQNLLEQIKTHAGKSWSHITQLLCTICSSIGIEKKVTCDNPYVSIPVIVFLFLFVFGIICLICCKCCCKKPCCKKDENDESDKSDESNVDYNQFIIGPDGQMYSQMYEGQMMDPQLYQAGMMYPQMYQGQMYYPQMLQEGMLQPEMYNMEMQQPVTQESGKKRKKKKKKRSSEHTSYNDDALLVGYNTM